jgi:hypothetical protein
LPKGNRQQATGNRQQATGNRQQATGNRQQATGNRQQATGNYTRLLNNYVNHLIARYQFTLNYCLLSLSKIPYREITALYEVVLFVFVYKTLSAIKINHGRNITPTGIAEMKVMGKFPNCCDKYRCSSIFINLKAKL